MAQDTVRSFLAIELSEALKNEASQFIETIRTKYSAFRFIPHNNWHLTLHFLGQVETRKIRELSTRTSKALDHIQPFSIFLEGLGVFPDWHRPRILWIGVGGDVSQLSALKKQLDQVLQKMHIQIETRPHHPHITIARFKESVFDLSPGPESHFRSRTIDQIHHITLFKSELLPTGAQHVPLETFSLGGS